MAKLFLMSTLTSAIHGLVPAICLVSFSSASLIVRELPTGTGLMPISAAKDETRKLFFWFFPSTNSDYTEDLVYVSPPILSHYLIDPG
jgi:hypothetical protein